MKQDTSITALKKCMSHSLRLLASAFGAAVLVGSTASTYAVTIDFGGFGATPNGTQWTTYSEDGFTLSATQNRWNVAQFFGNPVPDTFSDSNAVSEIQVVNDVTGFFSFNSVDLAQAGTGTSKYELTGFLFGSQVLYHFGTPSANSFSTVNSVNSTQLLDKLLIKYTYTSGTVFGYNIDNIVVNTQQASRPVPDMGGTLALFGLGLVALRGARTKMRA